jgi:hypothetical protein
MTKVLINSFLKFDNFTFQIITFLFEFDYCFKGPAPLLVMLHGNEFCS